MKDLSIDNKTLVEKAALLPGIGVLKRWHLAHGGFLLVTVVGICRFLYEH